MLVIALIIYVFISIAWIVGQSLWRIQEKVNRHEFTIADRKYVSQPCQCQRTALAICADGSYVQCREIGSEEVEKLRRKIKEKKEELEKSCKKVKEKEEAVKEAGKNVKETARNLRVCYGKIEKGKVTEDDFKKIFNAEIDSVFDVAKDMLNC